MTADKILDIARPELGVKESPRGSNNVKYNTWYYKREVSGAYPWCMVFVQWVFDQAGASELVPARTASCGTLMTYARRKDEWVTEGYQPGDVVIYDFLGGAATDHTGIVESATGTTVTAIEGNTSANDASNGGEVCRMTRKLGTVKGAWRPQYKEDEDDMTRYQKVTDIPDNYGWRGVVDDLMTAGVINGDGSDPDGNNDVIDLSQDMVRMLIFNYNAGVYDPALEAAGLNPGKYK